MLDEGPTNDISVGGVEQKFSINFSKAKRKFRSSLHCNDVKSYFSLAEKRIYKFKADNKNANSPTQFFFAELYIKNLIKMNLNNYFLKKMCTIFQSITVLLINQKF